MPEETWSLGSIYDCRCIDYDGMRQLLAQPDPIAKSLSVPVDAYILLETSPLPQWDMSEEGREHLEDLTLHDLLVCVVPLPKSDWLPDNNRLDYLAFISLNMYNVSIDSDENIFLVAGEPAGDKRSALNMLLWSIQTRIATKFVMKDEITISPS